MASEFTEEKLLEKVLEKYPELRKKDTTQIANIIKENFETFKEFDDLIQLDPRFLSVIYQRVKSEIESGGGST